MSPIELHHVSAGHAEVAPVWDLDIHVKPGEVVALLGANGAGKTTVVRTIAGLTQVQHGSVTLFGTDVTSTRPQERAALGLATVPDDRGLFTQLTVAENLRAGSTRRRPAPPLADWFPVLLPFLDRRAGLLSGGEQTMLALARALQARPGALVVDELTTGFAPRFAAAAFAVLRRTASEWGTAVLVAEQAPQAVLEIADRACVLRRGRIVLDGTPTQMAETPGVLDSAYLGDLR